MSSLTQSIKCVVRGQPLLQAQPQLWGTPPCMAQLPSPHSHSQPQPPHLCALPCCAPGPRQQFSGLWVGAGCAEPRGRLRLDPKVCPGWCLGSRPSQFLFIPSWAEPSVGMLIWILNWASRAEGGAPTLLLGRCYFKRNKNKNSQVWSYSMWGVRKIPWRREKLPTPVLWPREFHGL